MTHLHIAVPTKTRFYASRIHVLKMCRSQSCQISVCSVLSKDDILWFLQAMLAEIVRALPSAMPKAAKNTLLAYYFKTFAAFGEIDREKFVNLLLFCTADQQKSGNDVAEMEILAPPISNCTKCKSPLISQNKMCTVTVFTLQKVQSAMKLSCRCKDCKLNYGYSMFGHAEEGFRFYEVQRPYVEASDDVFLDRSLCLFQVSLSYVYVSSGSSP